MGNFPENKKLDFNAPFLSIRRLTAGASAADPSTHYAPAPVPPPTRRRFSLPFYKSEVKSGPVSSPGVVPFVWEQSPGRPKNDGRRPPVKPCGSSSMSTQKRSTTEEHVSKQAESEAAADERQPPTASMGNGRDVNEDGDDDIFTDAPDTLSRTESFLMTCSVSGVGSFRDVPSAERPQIQEYMIARFLPAAQALASESPQYTFRRPPTPARETPREANDRILSENLRKSPLVIREHALDNFPHFAQGIDADEDDYDDDDDGGPLQSRGCGLLPKFSLKGSLCLLNPFPGMRHRPRPPRSRRREMRSPEITNRQKPHWPDSATADDGWPAYRRPDGGGVSPYRYGAPPSPFREGKGFLGVPVSNGDGRNANEVNRRKTTVPVGCENQLEEEEGMAGKKKTDDVKANWDAYCSVKDCGGMSPLQSAMLAPKSPSEPWLLQAAAKSPRLQPSFLGLRFRPSIKPTMPSSIGRPSACALRRLID